ncbi:virulence RhuM family protein [Aestuariibaculum suncheonense]|uniref:Virulence RhuM family protein n=1 Tax=Aestuariibaculum suncheonense TaxID=1028745 RepID=A0A8J6UC97_9FLAO|nr:virulence RhuM family protein [Aestuariibaculum suncheonense]MBD0836535.1 virulence RhuM family protein [Aestuariibaculum suncheonense]
MSNLKTNNFLLYTNENGEVKVDVLLKDETIWLTINQMAELFGIDKSGISRHIKNVFETGELREELVVAKIATTTQHGAMPNKTQTKPVMYFNLDMIISVGYRVNSLRGTHFRMWATKQLTELIRKGFVLDNEKLKNPDNPFGKDYFDELLEQIRDIRSSEKRFYRKITDIYALAVDYSPKAEETQAFFKVVQNKLIFAATGNTAAEIIAKRSDVTKDNMGLTTFKGSKVRKQDVTVSKNYLNKDELDTLNRIVTMYLDFAELQAKNHRQMFMKDWRQKLDAFLQFNGQDILKNAGSITKKVADKLAEDKYETFRSKRLQQEQQQLGDIDNAIKKLK